MVIYKGNVDHIEAKQTIHKMTENGKIRFAEWSPTAKIWRDFYPLPPDIQSDEMVVSKSEAVMLANNTGITRFLNERITKKVDKLYSQRAYIHWYIKEGMEEEEFMEAREDLLFLEKDFCDVLMDAAAADYSDDEDESSSNEIFWT